MKIETEPQENCTLTMTVEVDDERVQPALRTAARRLAKKYSFPGFRPGKAPYEVVLRHVGEGALYSEALEDLGQKVYEEALKETKLEPFAPGELENVDLKPLVLKFTVPLKPEIELGDYRSLRVDYNPPEVTDETVQTAMDTLRDRHAELAPVDRAAEMGDQATLDAKGYLHSGENPSDFLLADENVSLILNPGGDWPVPGFAEQIAGLKAGDEKKFDLAFPDDYANTSLRGDVAHFEVKVKEVKRRDLPEWGDELAKTIGEAETLDELRAKVRAELEEQAQRTFRKEYSDQVVGRLVEQAQVKYPPVLLENELDEYMDDLDRRLREQRLTLDDYLKIESKTKEQLREELKPQAETRLKRTLVLGRVIDLERLAVGDEDVAHEITRVSAPWGDQSQQMLQALSSDRGRRMIALDLLTDKAIDRLIAVARGDDVPLPAAEAETVADAGAEAEAETVADAGAEAEAETVADAGAEAGGAPEGVAVASPAEEAAELEAGPADPEPTSEAAERTE